MQERAVDAFWSVASDLRGDPSAEGIARVLRFPIGTTSRGYPFLDKRGWQVFRDTVDHLFTGGARMLEVLTRLEGEVGDREGAEWDAVRGAMRVAGQVTRTASITAPPDLWLVARVTSNLAALGLCERLLIGEALYPAHCECDGEALDEAQLETDLTFLLSARLRRGVRRRLPRGGALVGALGAPPRRRRGPRRGRRRGPVRGRARHSGEPVAEEARAALIERVIARIGEPKPARERTHWMASAREARIGAALVPLILGLRGADRCAALEADRGVIGPEAIAPGDHDLGLAALSVLRAAGWVEPLTGRVSALGRRGFARGPGPFGIIETYHPYMTRGVEIVRRGRGQVWVARGENVGASQDANAKTFRTANDALDRFSAETGFAYSVFIEHAVGRGEATRQRAERDQEAGRERHYVGADLEDAAIDAAIEEQRAGKLPASMVFVRDADIGRPGRLLDAMAERGIEAEGAVMVVGNGFHEARDQTDDSMVEVFRGYHDAGVVLLFTEENALSIDDLRETAWNTYHAGFRYVHEKSGQCLRPAEPRGPVRLGRPMRAAWSECARAAGYVRAERYGD